MRVAIAMRYGVPPIMTALREDVCDGFAIGGGTNRVKANATVAAEAGKPFFLELAGAGIAATFSLHFASVLTHARWPRVDCHRIHTHQMIRPAVQVQNGSARSRSSRVTSIPRVSPTTDRASLRLPGCNSDAPPSARWDCLLKRETHPGTLKPY
jgi:hypothetical protein